MVDFRVRWRRGGGRAAITAARLVTDGVAVNGLGSTVYNVAVGGTDFGDTLAGQVINTYWNSTNTRDLRLGAIVHPGNSLEHDLRQPAVRDH